MTCWETQTKIRLYHNFLSCPSFHQPDQFLVLKFYTPTGILFGGLDKGTDGHTIQHILPHPHSFFIVEEWLV